MGVIREYKKELFLALLFFILLTSGGGILLYTQFQERKHDALMREIQEMDLLFQSTLEGLQTLANNTYALEIDTPQVLMPMLAANDPSKRATARKRLYLLLLPVYRRLQTIGVRQFHFHLPQNISFLRFHMPSKYGDSLKGVRYSIDLVNKTKKAVHGFEEGRVFNGFRNVYPLLYEGKFVGSVEISFSLRALIRNMLKLRHGFYGLLMRDDIVANKVWQTQRKHYESSILARGYSWDKEALEYMLTTLHETLSPSVFHDIEKLLAPQVNERLKKNKPFFLIPFSFEDTHYVAVFRQIKNIQNKPVAYFVATKKDTIFQKQFENFSILAIFGGSVALLSAYLVFIYLKKQHDFTRFLQQESHHDPLTDLLNRRGFFTTVRPLVHNTTRSGGIFSILFLDIDHFKRINDTFGHEIGDKVLEAIASVLRETLRQSDVIARWGGEEFVIYLHAVSKEEAYAVAQKIRRTIESLKNDAIPNFTVSIGVSDAKNGLYDIVQTIHSADDALYIAKKTGRNKVVLSNS